MSDAEIDIVERYLKRYGIADARWVARQIVDELAMARGIEKLKPTTA